MQCLQTIIAMPCRIMILPGTVNVFLSKTQIAGFRVIKVLMRPPGLCDRETVYGQREFIARLVSRLMKMYGFSLTRKNNQ